MATISTLPTKKMMKTKGESEVKKTPSILFVFACIIALYETALFLLVADGVMMFCTGGSVLYKFLPVSLRFASEMSYWGGESISAAKYLSGTSFLFTIVAMFLWLMRSKMIKTQGQAKISEISDDCSTASGESTSEISEKNSEISEEEEKTVTTPVAPNRQTPEAVKAWLKHPKKVQEEEKKGSFVAETADKAGRSISFNINDFFNVVVPDDRKMKFGMRFLDTSVIKVVPGCWAAENGVQVDDEIIAVNGESFATMNGDERRNALVQTKRPFSITFKRPVEKDTYFTVEFAKGSFVDAKSGEVFAQEFFEAASKQLSGQNYLGFQHCGDVVINVEEKTWAAGAGIIPGDVIQEVNGTHFRLLNADRVKALLGDDTTNWCREETETSVKIEIKRPNKDVNFNLNMLNSMRHLLGFTDVQEWGQLN